MSYDADRRLYALSATRIKLPVSDRISPTKTSVSKNPILRWVYVSRIPIDLLVSKNSETSSVKYSNVELTALNLVQYASRIGGLSLSATVLDELCEVTDFTKLNDAFLDYVKISTFQRLGYILDEILERHEQAEEIYRFLSGKRKQLHYVKLSSKSTLPVNRMSKKWKIENNTQIEIDDL